MLLRYLRLHGAGENAEDLLHELWLKAERARAPADLSRGYLMRMAHNLIIDQARSARQRGLRESIWHLDGPSAGAFDASPDAERSLIARERLQNIDATLGALGPRTEAILRRHRIEGIPQTEIAREQNISLSAVEKHLQKAYRAIALAQREGESDR
jgi:RNA polymerase sigma-70 factor (ECF subfamily)